MDKTQRSEFKDYIEHCNSDDDYVNFGFVFRTSCAEVAEDNFEERQNRELTVAEWNIINDDVSTMEMRFVEYLRKIFFTCREEGHNSCDEIVGSCWIKKDDKKALEYLADFEDGESVDIYVDYDMEKFVTEGISDITRDAIDCSYGFFEFDEDEIKELIEGIKE